MISSPLTKLIDEAIIPASTLVIGKMFGILAAIFFLHLPATLENAAFLKILPSIRFQDTQSYILAENYSNLAMFAASAIGSILVIIRAHFLHDSHISPKLHAKLARFSLDILIAPSYHLYYQAAVWLTFLWLSVGFLIVSAFLKITYIEIASVAFIVAANFSWIFALDVEREIQIQQES